MRELRPKTFLCLRLNLVHVKAHPAECLLITQMVTGYPTDRLLQVTQDNRASKFCVIYYYYSVCCLTTGPKPLPKRFLHMVRSKAPSFK